MRLLAFLLLIVLMGIGFLRLLYRVHRLKENRAALNLFVTKLQRFSEQYQEQFDTDLYYWLNRHAMAVHKMASDPAFWKTFGHRFEETAVQRAESLVAILDEMGQKAVHYSRVMSLLSFLNRFLGILEDSIEKTRKQRMNPLLLFSEGVLFLLGSPTLAYGWMSGSPDSPFDELSRSARFRRRAGLLALAMLVLSVVILVVGWAPLVQTSRQAYSSAQTWLLEVAETWWSPAPADAPKDPDSTPAEPPKQPQ